MQVKCANCFAMVVDEGKGKTCPKCGCSPLPSYAYPENCSFHPDHKPPEKRKNVTALSK